MDIEGLARKDEFIDLFKRSGFSQASAARELDITRAHVNGIITGDTVPSPTLLKFFRLIVGTPQSGMVLTDRPLQKNPPPFPPEVQQRLKARALELMEKILALQSDLDELEAGEEQPPQQHLTEAQRIAVNAKSEVVYGKYKRHK